MRLTNPESRYAPASHKRVDEALDAGCPCGGEDARLTKRKVGAAVTIHLQCERCGRSIAGALPRNDFWFYQQYPEWDEGLRDEYNAEKDGKADEYRAGLNKALEERRAEYARWLASNPEWATLRARVLSRAGGECESCLNARATDVHHLTYRYGKLPPAWELKAICRKCHEKLHDGWGIGLRLESVPSDAPE